MVLLAWLVILGFWRQLELIFWINDVHCLPDWSTKRTPDNGPADTSDYRPWSFDKCVPQNNIYYLRIHKTGSSTITTLLYRYALRHDVKMVLCSDHPYLYNSTRQAMFTYPNGLIYNKGSIFAEHAFYNKAETNSIMPHNTVYLASIRDPVTLLPSLLQEFVNARELLSKYTALYNMAEYFLSHLDKYGSVLRMPTKSLMSRLFGIPDDRLDDLKQIERILYDVSTEFQFVIVKEYFDESLIILRRKMCWEMRDILYLSQRALWRRRLPMTRINQERYRKWSAADFMLYRYFTDKLLSRELPTNTDFWDELTTFRQMNTELVEFCQPFLRRLAHRPSDVINLADDFSVILSFDPKPWGKPFIIHPVDCAIMKLDTTVMMNIFKVRQIPELCGQDRGHTVHAQSVTAAIRWINTSTIYLHPAYCSPIHPVYGVPMEVLSLTEAYMPPIFAEG